MGAARLAVAVWLQRLLHARQVWLAPVPFERATAVSLLWEPLLKQWLFFRELLALAWYFVNGWLC